MSLFGRRRGTKPELRLRSAAVGKRSKYSNKNLRPKGAKYSCSPEIENTFKDILLKLKIVYYGQMLDILDEFKRPIQGRIAYFLFLFPFIPAAWPLFKEPVPLEVFFYFAGLLLILSLIVYSTMQPFLICRNNALQINLPYRHEPEIHLYEEILGFRIKKEKTVYLNSINQREIKFTLNRNECRRLSELLEGRGVFRQNEK